MKKIISLLTIVMLLILCIMDVLAYDEEITFQNVPWGSSLDEVKEAMINIYGNEKPMFVRFTYGFGYMDCINEDGSVVKGQPMLHAEYRLFRSTKDRVNIAGYDASVFFDFAFKRGTGVDLDNMDENTAMIADKQLIYVRFTIKAENEVEAKEDLIKKISDIYGEGIEDQNNKTVIWKGANNTEIKLAGPGSYIGDPFCIWYRKYLPLGADYVTPTPVPVNTPEPPSNNVDPNNKNGL